MVRAAWWIFALMVVAIILVPLKCARAGQSYIAQDAQGTVVRLLDAPCTSIKATDEWFSKWAATLMRASMRYRGKNFDACWFVVGAVVVVIDSALDVTPLPISAFTPEPQT